MRGNKQAGLGLINMRNDKKRDNRRAGQRNRHQRYFMRTRVREFEMHLPSNSLPLLLLHTIPKYLVPGIRSVTTGTY